VTASSIVPVDPAVVQGRHSTAIAAVAFSERTIAIAPIILFNIVVSPFLILIAPLAGA
jgi:hypothetical protein